MTIRVEFQPSGRSVHVMPGTTLFEAASRAGLLLQGPCGGAGTCGKCRVRIVDGASAASTDGHGALSDEEIAEGWRLACRETPARACTVEIPSSSLFERRARILVVGRSGVDAPPMPAVRCESATVPAVPEGDDTADLERLRRARAFADVDLGVLRVLPGRLRESGGDVRLLMRGERLIDMWPAASCGACLGLAVDVGTTTLVGTLMDLSDGREVDVATALNPQIQFGDDVIARITRTREEPGAERTLQTVVVDTLNELIHDLCRRTGCRTGQIVDVTAAGNTTMQHLLCGISPAALGEVPFPPVFRRGLSLSAADIGLKVHPRAGLYVFPNVGGFVGGDTVAGMLANALADAETPTLLVDIGTNGEIVLAHEGRLYASSAAAGPAFEGARIQAGMRAAEGAIEKVAVRNGDLVCNVIGGGQAMGLCGTALIDGVAEALRLGVLGTTGLLAGPDDCPAGVSDAVRARLDRDDGDARLLLAGEHGDSGIYLCQRDIRELQLASGAIRAGIRILLRRVGLTGDDLGQVLLAGGFGNYIRRENARRIGLLPPVPLERIQFVGNAASVGARLALCHEDLRAEADRLADLADHVDLSSDPEFQMEFGMAMMFPENDDGSSAMIL